MLKTIQERYGAQLDVTLRTAISEIKPSELKLMLRYVFGWVDENGTEIEHIAGKRLRPFLLLMCCEAAGGDWQAALPAAAAVELMHNFSLVHDDIQDQSTTRHNRPSVWSMWDQASAINAGDSLLSLAFHTLATLHDTFPPKTVLGCWHDLNTALRELTRGQHLDMQFEKTEHVDEASYFSMIEGKTAALLATSAKMGARLAQHEQLDHFGEYGRQLGLAFQIRDDILGIWGVSATTGKSTSDDIMNKKKSLPTLYGLQQESEFVKLFRKETITDQDVADAIHLLNRCNAREYSEAAEQRHCNASTNAISSLQTVNEVGKWLGDFPAILLGREI